MTLSTSNVLSSSQYAALRAIITNFSASPEVADALDRLQWTPSTLEGLELSEDIQHESALWTFVTSRFRSDFKDRKIARCVMVLGSEHNDASEFLRFHQEQCGPNSSAASAPTFSDPGRAATYSKMMEMAEKTASRSSAPLLFCWHAVDNTGESVHHVCLDNLSKCKNADGGYFGIGVYFSTEAQYAATYSDPGHCNESAVVLFAVSPTTQVYPITTMHYRTPEEEAGVKAPLRGFSKLRTDKASPIALKPGNNAHFIPVKTYGKVHPRNGNSLDFDVDYQAAPHNEAEFHELLVASHHQCHPIAIVYLSHGTSDTAAPHPCSPT
jgi:hypothetical protein